MAIKVRDKGGEDFTPAPSGLQRAVCCDVVELGLVETAFGKKRKVQISWQSERLMDTGKPFLISKRYGATLHPMGTLRPDLESWRGKPLTQAEADDFDLEVLLNKNCQLLIVHNTKDGKTYGNVQTVVPAVKGLPPLTVTADYIRRQDRENYVAPDMGPEPGEEDGPPVETAVETDDDPVPF